MLNGNDIDLFYKLLDSLGESLKELAVKYEVLVRNQDADARSLEDVKTAIAGTHFAIEDISRSVGSLASDDQMKRLQDSVCQLREVLAHLDMHMDDTEGSLGTVIGKFNAIEANTKAVNELRVSMVPLAKLSSMIRKPLTIVLIIYVFLATVIAFAKVAEWTNNKLFSAEPKKVESLDITKKGSE